MLAVNVTFLPNNQRKSDPPPSTKTLSTYQCISCKSQQKVQLSRIGGLLNAFQRTIDEVRKLPLTPKRVAKKANLSFKNRFPYSSVIDEACDFRISKPMRFAKAHHKITPKGKRWRSRTLGELPKMWGFPLIFLQPLKLATSNYACSWGLLRPIIKLHPEEKWAWPWTRELPKIQMLPSIFTQWQKLATLNLAHSLSLPMPIIKSHTEEKWAWD